MLKLLMSISIVASVALGAANPEARRKPKDAGLTVHEWGTFTTVSSPEGQMLKWRPLDTASDLPKFVHWGFGPWGGLPKVGVPGTVRMETPVLYFYTDRETTASVTVEFPKGLITEYYPRAANEGTSITWSGFRIAPNAPAEFPLEPAPSPYYQARGTRAAPIQVDADGVQESERFLFYRGVGTFDVPIAARLEGESVRVKNVGSSRISQVLLLEKHGDAASYDIRCTLDPGAEVVIPRPKGGHGNESLVADLKKILVGQRLTADEAEAMVRTWESSWFEDGLRVLYTVPRDVTDAVLPITIDPEPGALERVLVGRLEMITPEMVAAIKGAVERLGDESSDVREEASRTVESYGRFAEPVLRRLRAAATDEKIQNRIGGIIGNE